MNSISWADIVGSLGAVTIVTAYMFLQLGRINSVDLVYSLLNATGAALILFSLYFKFNLSAFLIEFFWLLISIYGIVASKRNSAKAHEN